AKARFVFSGSLRTIWRSLTPLCWTYAFQDQSSPIAPSRVKTPRTICRLFVTQTWPIVSQSAPYDVLLLSNPEVPKPLLFRFEAPTVTDWLGWLVAAEVP